MAIKSPMDTSRRYLSLRVISVFLVAQGVALMVIGFGLLISGVATLVAGPHMIDDKGMKELGVFGGYIAIGWSWSIMLTGLFSTACGAMIRLLIHVEENTRATGAAPEHGTFQPDGAEPYGSGRGERS